MSQEQLEEYLETIFDLAGKDGTAKTTAIANKLHVSPASVTEYIQGLAAKDLVDYEPYVGAKLSDAGLEIVTRLKRRHRLLEVFLSDVLKIDAVKVHPEAYRIEHYMSDETADALCRWLEAPARSPHGKFIGPCEKPLETCKQCEDTSAIGSMKTSGDNGIIPVTDLEPNQEGSIAFIRGDRRTVQRLSDLGLTLRAEVRLVRRAPLNGPVEICVRNTRLAIDGDIADNIFVTRAGAQ
ncbi:MAG: metal-dependent transcriptional regulator [Candidatus Methanomethylophilaceae archaeon]|nr:metal-dependent transcriptional regulator [Candidatus Methanomethylophilaceae archaeon]